MESFSKLDRESNELDQKRRDLLREDKAQVSTHEGAARE
jgi:hypothetical protein